MLAILIYIVAAIAVVVIGLVTVGRETFAASLVPPPAVFEFDEAVEFVSGELDDRTAARLTPDDVEWIIQIDAVGLASTEDDPGAPGVVVFDDDEAVRRVMEKLDTKRGAFVDEADVRAVIVARTRYLEAIGAIGSRAPEVDDELGDPAPSEPI